MATLSREFGAFLLIEVWAVHDAGPEVDPRAIEVLPRFRVYAPQVLEASSTVDALVEGLGKLKVMKRAVAVELARVRQVSPPGMRPLLSRARARELHCALLGIGVPPIYRDPHTGAGFPLVLRTLRCAIRSGAAPCRIRLCQYPHDSSSQAFPCLGSPRDGAGRLDGRHPAGRSQSGL